MQAFGGIPILRFDEAVIENNKLICKYATEFAKFYFDGFGFVIDREGGLGSIPYDFTLTMNESFLSDWSPSRKTVKIPSYHRGDVIYTLDAPTGQCYSWHGAFYKSVYNGNQITLQRNYEDEARVNNEGTGFIIADTQTGLFSPGLNTDYIKNSGLKGKQNLGKKEDHQTVTKVNSKEFDKNAKIKTSKSTKKKNVKKEKKKTIK